MLRPDAGDSRDSRSKVRRGEAAQGRLEPPVLTRAAQGRDVGEETRCSKRVRMEVKLLGRPKLQQAPAIEQRDAVPNPHSFIGIMGNDHGRSP